ncbi:MAG: flagellar brake protein, partial [Clostridiales bacterium]|nr:flagellar brake protein [Clostridiales bacterium]
MFFKHVKIGDRLEIYEENKKDIVYASQVEEVKEKRALVIHMPISFGQYIKLKEKNKYTVIFFTDSGLLRYEAVIEKHKVEDGFNLTEIKLNSNGERMQRREFFR